MCEYQKEQCPAPSFAHLLGDDLPIGFQLKIFNTERRIMIRNECTALIDDLVVDTIGTVGTDETAHAPTVLFL